MCWPPLIFCDLNLQPGERGHLGTFSLKAALQVVPLCLVFVVVEHNPLIHCLLAWLVCYAITDRDDHGLLPSLVYYMCGVVFCVLRVVSCQGFNFCAIK